MALQGVLSDAHRGVYEEMKKKRSARALFFSFDPNTKPATYALEDSHTLAPDSDYGAFLDKIQKDFAKTPVYAIVDIQYESEDGRPQEKLVFVQWVPDTSPVKQRMAYGSGAENFKKQLDTGLLTIQASDFDEISFEEVKKKCTKK